MDRVILGETVGDWLFRLGVPTATVLLLMVVMPQ